MLPKPRQAGFQGKEEEGIVTSAAASERQWARRVLIVEDDPAVMRYLTATLTAEGYEPIVARNGVEALVSLTAPQPEFPDAVLLDLGLPLEGGVSVLSFLRTVLHSPLPVIVITGRQDPDEERTVRELGVSAFLVKPASARKVLGAIADALC